MRPHPNRMRAFSIGAAVPMRPPAHRPPGWKPPEVQRREYDRARAPQKNAIYDAAWRKCRKLFLREYPICCEHGCGQPATDVDHVVGVRERPDLRLSWSNLRPFCHAHHSARTSRDQSWNR